MATAILRGGSSRILMQAVSSESIYYHNFARNSALARSRGKTSRRSGDWWKKGRETFARCSLRLFRPAHAWRHLCIHTTPLCCATHLPPRAGGWLRAGHLPRIAQQPTRDGRRGGRPRASTAGAAPLWRCCRSGGGKGGKIQIAHSYWFVRIARGSFVLHGSVVPEIFLIVTHTRKCISMTWKTRNNFIYAMYIGIILRPRRLLPSDGWRIQSHRMYFRTSILVYKFTWIYAWAGISYEIFYQISAETTF